MRYKALLLFLTFTAGAASASAILYFYNDRTRPTVIIENKEITKPDVDRFLCDNVKSACGYFDQQYHMIINGVDFTPLYDSLREPEVPLKKVIPMLVDVNSDSNSDITTATAIIMWRRPINDALRVVGVALVNGKNIYFTAIYSESTHEG